MLEGEGESKAGERKRDLAVARETDMGEERGRSRKRA